MIFEGGPPDTVFYLQSLNSSISIAYLTHNSKVGHKAGITSLATCRQRS